jgi:hypothetical protein
VARACGDLFNDTQIYPSVGCRGAHTQSRASQWPPKAPETFFGESSRFNFTAHRALCAGTDTKPAVPSIHKWFTSKVESEAQCCLSHIERTRTKIKNKLVSFIDDRGAVAAAALFFSILYTKQTKPKKPRALPSYIRMYTTWFGNHVLLLLCATHHVNVPFAGPVATAINTTSDIVGNQTRDWKKDEGEKNPRV